MFRGIDTVRRLWRGEAVRFPGPDQKEVEVRTLPRPVQAELPVWVTVAGNPETFRRAGAGGFRVLTHLLGQNVEQLAEKLAIYRTAWRESGHPGDGYVTLMLHTFVGDDDDQVREVVREPMIEYLASALDLTEKAAWSFPAFKERASATGQTLSQMFAAESLTPEEKSAILNHAFERYFETSGLFGTVETCLAMVRAIEENRDRRAGVPDRLRGRLLGRAPASGASEPLAGAGRQRAGARGGALGRLGPDRPPQGDASAVHPLDGHPVDRGSRVASRPARVDDDARGG